MLGAAHRVTDSLGLTDKVAIVTGGGRNIGREICLTLARHGCDVVVNVRSNTEEGESVAGEVKSLGRRALLVVADVGDPAAVTCMVEQAVDHFGRVDVLVNNATYRPGVKFLEMSDEMMERVFAVTLFGPVHACRAVLPHMMSQGSGSIVSISGTVVHLGSWTQLAAAKAGVVGLTRGIAKEFGPAGIRANLIEPSTIDTINERPPLPEKVAAELGRTPLGRIGERREVAEVCAFLAGDMSSFITGQTIHVNGGQFMP